MNVKNQAQFRYSVVVPTVGENLLSQTLVSVLSQSIEPCEVLVVDDSIGQDIELEGIKVLKSGGGRGPSFSRNLGVRYASEAWIAFCDADDPWLPKKIENQFKDILDRELDFSLTSAIFNGIVRPKTVLQPMQDPYELLYKYAHLFRSKAYLPTGSFLFNKEKINFFDESLSDRENIEFLYRSFKRGLRIGQLSSAEIIVNYKVHNSMKRFNVDLEYEWYERLNKINTRYAKNFQIESIRNAFRTRSLIKIIGLLKLYLS